MAKISKAQAYESMIFCAAYDLRGMIEAYGTEYVCKMIEQINEGNIEIVVKELRAKRDARGRFTKRAA